ncbi:MAG: nitrogenase molybdenum-iron protein alpha chain [Gaiellales bacterium]|nr:MAG: nitrogenase molybdenum-iron protein alpha chain [Gaiellales bacterium]
MPSSEKKIEKHRQLRDSIIDSYPAKVGKRRSRHLVVKGEGDEQVEANAKTIPGIITTRGCAFAGCKGVVLGPIKDAVNLVHGPVGCSYYSWLTRRNFARPGESGKNYLQYCVTTDMQEGDIVFGGEKKLMQAIREVKEALDPEAIIVSATCPVGLIGDDIASVAREAEAELGVKVFSANCEGYKGVSQSVGHHIACNALMENVVGSEEPEETTPFDVNIFGEYNIGGDLWNITPLLEKIGYRVLSTYTGDASIHDLARAPRAKLNVLMCHRSINYAAQMFWDRYQLPWLKVNYVGVDETARSLREMARFFEDDGLMARTEEVIAEELERVRSQLDHYRGRLAGRRVMLFVGGSRAHHFQHLCEDLGMEVVLAGYEFAHRDDYEGRQVLSGMSRSSLSKVVQDISYELESGFEPAFSEEELGRKGAALEGSLLDYEGMNAHMKEGALIVDDLNHHETEVLVRELRPDVFCSGIKDKYVVEKMGVPSRQLHSYDYSGPYTGFEGALTFARDMEMAVYTPTTRFMAPPWKKEAPDGDA